MNAEDISFLNNHRFFVESYSQESPPRHMRMMDRERLLKIVNENFGVKLTPDLWCDSCVAAFVINAYGLYDKYLKDEYSKH